MAVYVPGEDPRVKVASAKPLAFVVIFTWPEPPKVPPPPVTLKVTCTPATGFPAASTTRTVYARPNGVPRSPLCASPRTLCRAAAIDPLVSGRLFQLETVTLPATLSPVAVGSARRRGPRASPHQICGRLTPVPTSFRTPAVELSKISSSRALKFDNEPMETPTLLVETKLESSRALNDPPSTRNPALNRCPVTVFCTIVIRGAVPSSAARATRVSPGAGLNPVPDTVFPVAVKLNPENETAARLSRNVDCCTRKNPPPTETAYAAPPPAVQPWNQLLVSVMELALVA